MGWLDGDVSAGRGNGMGLKGKKGLSEDWFNVFMMSIISHE